MESMQLKQVASSVNAQYEEHSTRLTALTNENMVNYTTLHHTHTSSLSRVCRCAL